MMKRCRVVLMSCVYKLFEVYQGTCHCYSCVMFLHQRSTWLAQYLRWQLQKKVPHKRHIDDNSTPSSGASRLLANHFVKVKPGCFFLPDGGKPSGGSCCFLSLAGYCFFFFFKFQQRQRAGRMCRGLQGVGSVRGRKSHRCADTASF